MELKGIRLSHGVIFVTDGRITVRLRTSGACEMSPITYPQLERDLAYEPPSKWDYLTESEILTLPESERIVATINEIHEKYGI